MLMLFPLFFAALVYAWLAWEQKAQADWARHPDRPWNVTNRLYQEQFERERSAFEAQRKAVT
jgi:hypothetical protein